MRVGTMAAQMARATWEMENNVQELPAGDDKLFQYDEAEQVSTRFLGRVFLWSSLADGNLTGAIELGERARAQTHTRGRMRVCLCCNRGVYRCFR